jgi:hypothetical protein
MLNAQVEPANSQDLRCRGNSAQLALGWAASAGAGLAPGSRELFHRALALSSVLATVGGQGALEKTLQARPCASRRLLRLPHQARGIFPRQSARVALGIERMPEAGNRHAGCQMRRNDRARVRSRDLVHQRPNAQRGIAVQRSRQRRKTRQHARGKGRACRGRNARREAMGR